MDHEQIARTFEDFRRGEGRSVDEVRRWIDTVVRGGNWRFADADGVSQEVLVRLFDTCRQDRVRDPGSFKKFVYSVARHVCTRWYYRERRQPDRQSLDPVHDDAASESTPQGDLMQRERLDTVLYVFQRLPESCRKLWTLVYGDGLPADEVAERLGITPNNVRVRVHRCLTRAREICREAT